MFMVARIKMCWNELWGRETGFLVSASNLANEKVVPGLAVPGLAMILMVVKW